MTKKNKPTAPTILRLIRARAGDTPVLHVAKGAGIPYSRAHSLLKGDSDHHLINIEKALAYLAPDVMRAIEKAANK